MQNPTAFTSIVAFLKKLDWVPFCSVTNSKSKHTPRMMTGDSHAALLLEVFQMQ